MVGSFQAKSEWYGRGPTKKSDSEEIYDNRGNPI